MPRLSTLSNPTGIVDIDRSRVSISIDEDGKNLAFSLVRLDLSGLHLPDQLNIIVIARRGNSEERVDLGSTSGWNKGYRPLLELSDSGTWAFRLLLVQSGSPRLVAAAENVRPEGNGESDAFIALERADLGQVPWEISILEQDGRAVIRFNQEIFQSQGEAAASIFFMSLVMPEALRHLARWIACRPDAIEDACWEPFKTWLNMHGVDDPPSGDDEELREVWCNEAVGAFCERFAFATQLAALRAKGSEE